MGELVIPANTVYPQDFEAWWNSHYSFRNVPAYKYIAWHAWQAARAAGQAFRG